MTKKEGLMNEFSYFGLDLPEEGRIELTEETGIRLEAWRKLLKEKSSIRVETLSNQWITCNKRRLSLQSIKFLFCLCFQGLSADGRGWA